MKRSSKVALLLMGAAGVGAASYAMMRGNDCAPAPGSAVAGTPSGNQDCSSRRSASGSGGHGVWGSSWGSRGGSGNSSGSGSADASSSRGGFGGTGHAAAGHSSGG